MALALMVLALSGCGLFGSDDGGKGSASVKITDNFTLNGQEAARWVGSMGREEPRQCIGQMLYQ